MFILAVVRLLPLQLGLHVLGNRAGELANGLVEEVVGQHQSHDPQVKGSRFLQDFQSRAGVVLEAVDQHEVLVRDQDHQNLEEDNAQD